jgi:hypothetical protein
MYSNAQYVNHPFDRHCLGISVEINGTYVFVPIDESNMDYQNIMQLVAEGKLTIAPAIGA